LRTRSQSTWWPITGVGFNRPSPSESRRRTNALQV
jgi:hypothetical protein